MIRERLKDIDFRITELADYLQITRPTLYKFIDSYDSKDYQSINPKVLKLFKYIEGNELAGKKTILNYILTALVSEKEMGLPEEVERYSKIKKYMMANPNSNKSILIENLTCKNDFNELVDYLCKIQPLIRKRKLTNEELKLLEPYKVFIESIK